MYHCNSIWMYTLSQTTEDGYIMRKRKTRIVQSQNPLKTQLVCTNALPVVKLMRTSLGLMRPNRLCAFKRRSSSNEVKSSKKHLTDWPFKLTLNIRNKKTNTSPFLYKSLHLFVLRACQQLTHIEYTCGTGTTRHHILYKQTGQGIQQTADYSHHSTDTHTQQSEACSRLQLEAGGHPCKWEK